MTKIKIKFNSYVNVRKFYKILFLAICFLINWLYYYMNFYVIPIILFNNEAFYSAYFLNWQLINIAYFNLIYNIIYGF